MAQAVQHCCPVCPSLLSMMAQRQAVQACWSLSCAGRVQAQLLLMGLAPVCSSTKRSLQDQNLQALRRAAHSVQGARHQPYTRFADSANKSHDAQDRGCPAASAEAAAFDVDDDVDDDDDDDDV